MALWQNTVEGGLANGTALTPANSGGTAGDPFSSIAKSAAATVNVTTTPISGTRSMAFTTASAEFAQFIVSGYATLSMSVAAEFDCAELRTATANGRIVQILGAVGTTGVRLAIVAAGNLVYQSNAGVNLFTSAVIPATGKITINMACTGGTTTTDGTARFAYYIDAATTPAETAYYGTGLNILGAGTNPNLIDARFGKIATGVWAGTVRGDNFRINDTSDALLLTSTPPPTVQYPLRWQTSTGLGYARIGFVEVGVVTWLSPAIPGFP